MAYHSGRLIFGSDVYKLTKGDTWYLEKISSFGEIHHTDILPLTETFLIIGHKKYFTVTVWKWSNTT